MDFFLAIDRVLKSEGGYVNDPNDPGGETIYGISRRSFPNFNGGDFKNATREQAVRLYYDEFWRKVNADKMPEDLQYQALDFAVNSGIHTAIRKLQSAAGVADDGWWGPVTQAAVAATPPAVLIIRFAAERLDYMRKLKNWKFHGAGWAARMADVLRYAAVDLLEPDKKGA
jgi:lysozyme family protein